MGRSDYEYDAWRANFGRCLCTLRSVSALRLGACGLYREFLKGGLLHGPLGRPDIGELNALSFQPGQA